MMQLMSCAVLDSNGASHRVTGSEELTCRSRQKQFTNKWNRCGLQWSLCKWSQDISRYPRWFKVLPAALSLWAVWWQFPVLQRCNVDSGHSLCARHAAGLCFWHCLGDQQSPWQATEERWEHDWQRAGWNLAEAVKICSCCQYFTCCGLSCRWHFKCLVFREK